MVGNARLSESQDHTEAFLCQTALAGHSPTDQNPQPWCWGFVLTSRQATEAALCPRPLLNASVCFSCYPHCQKAGCHHFPFLCFFLFSFLLLISLPPFSSLSLPCFLSFLFYEPPFFLPFSLPLLSFLLLSLSSFTVSFLPSSIPF